MTTLKERFEKEAVVLTRGDIQDMADGDSESPPFVYINNALSFFRQELLALAEEVESIGLGVKKGDPDKQGGYYGGLEDAAALIRSKADELV